MKLQDIKATRDGGAGTGLGGAGNVRLGEMRQASVMGGRSQDRIRDAETKAQIDAVAKRGLGALSEDPVQNEELTEKQKKKNPFWQHPESSGKFMSIQDPTERKRLAYALGRLDDYCKAHETLLGQGSQMAHSEMISAMLFDEETLVPLPPLMCTTFKKVIADTGATKEFRFGVKIYMTNRRLICMDAKVVRTATLDDTLPQEAKSFFLRQRHKVEVEVGDRSWYYPVPLSQLKGLSLEINYSTKATAYLSQRRPIYLIAVLLGSGLVLLNYTLAEIIARNNSLTDAYDEVIENFDAAGDTIRNGQDMEQSEANFWAQLFGGLFLCGITPLLFFYYKAYSHSRFKPRMFQSRQITMGILDPLYQQQAVYYLDIDDRYSPVRIRNYLNRLQSFAPHIAGKVLTTG